MIVSKYNITMKQKNDSDYDELYPESLDTQIKLSKVALAVIGWGNKCPKDHILW